MGATWRTLAVGGIRWAVALGFAVPGCGSGSGQPAPPAGGGSGGSRDQVVPVEVARAELSTAARSVTATGTVEPLRTVVITSQLAGSLMEVLVEEGAAVRAGAVLARIDSREIEAQLASAEAALEVARRTAERAERLYQQQIVTDAEYERDRAAHAAALATRDQLRTRLGYATVRAPIAGTVLTKRVEMGDVVAPQTRLFTIGDVSTLVVRVPISERDVASLGPGDRAAVSLDALPRRPVEGRIRRVFPSADSVTRLVPVEVALTGAAAREVRPGFLARVTFRLDPRSDVLMVPAGAVLEQASGASVFVLREGRATRRAVQRGGTFQGRVEIVSGLVAGDTVVVTGSAMLREGAAVRIVEGPAVESAGGQVPPGAAESGGRTP